MKKVLFNLSEEQYDRLAKLAKSMGVSKSEAMRRAIELYMLFKQWKAEDEEIIRRSKGGTERFVEIIG